MPLLPIKKPRRWELSSLPEVTRWEAEPGIQPKHWTPEPELFTTTSCCLLGGETEAQKDASGPWLREVVTVRARCRMQASGLPAWCPFKGAATSCGAPVSVTSSYDQLCQSLAGSPKPLAARPKEPLGNSLRNQGSQTRFCQPPQISSGSGCLQIPAQSPASIRRNDFQEWVRVAAT